MEITSENIFNMSRREVLRALGLTAAASLVSFPAFAESTHLLEITPEIEATTFNNFYEFGYGKGDPYEKSQNFNTDDWIVEIDGLVKNSLKFSIKDILSKFKQEEYIYRMRCVEGWSVVIPWQGFQLRQLIEEAQPESEAKFVSFTSYADSKQMPAVGTGSFPFPYKEGLRLDEALFPLTIMATGAYGKSLLPQNGAPIRLVVPWKYGFKSIKSLVKITLTSEQPKTTWDSYNPREYGFYSNVNPDVPHRRWSQAVERVIGAGGIAKAKKEPTLLFNGYDQVATLYEGMDLVKNY